MQNNLNGQIVAVDPSLLLPCDTISRFTRLSLFLGARNTVSGIISFQSAGKPLASIFDDLSMRFDNQQLYAVLYNQFGLPRNDFYSSLSHIMCFTTANINFYFHTPTSTFKVHFSFDHHPTLFFFLIRACV